MVQCNCGREFANTRSLRAHSRSCKSYRALKKPKLEGQRICEDCKREFTTSQGLNSHYSRCEIRASRLGRIRMLNRGVFGKISEEEKQEWIRKSLETRRRNIENGIVAKKRAPMSIEHRRKLSEYRHRQNEKNEGHCKWYEVESVGKKVKVQGTWERDVAKRLNDLEIHFERKRVHFDEARSYMPDFYLPDLDTFIEVKGWWKDRDIQKMNSVVQETQIKVLLIDSKTIFEKFCSGEILLTDLASW